MPSISIGVPKELLTRGVAETRVALTPSCIKEIVKLGAKVFVEHNAGAGSGFTDEGGCVESARITDPDNVIKIENGVLYYAPPNVPSLVSRTASHALSNSLLPYLKQIIEKGIEDAIKECIALRTGTCIYKGKITADFLASVEHPYYSIELLMGEVE